VSCRLIALDLDNHLLNQRTQQLLPVAWRGRGRSIAARSGLSVPKRSRSSIESMRGRSSSWPPQPSLLRVMSDFPPTRSRPRATSRLSGSMAR
jgi:hypothetical protein